MFDSFGREISYLRISVTDRCNLRCVYCMPAEGIRLLPHENILSYEQITDIARVATRLGIRKIRLTGGEPLARKNIVELVRMLRPLEGLATLAMTTNGTLLAPLASPLADAGLDSINISIDTLDPERYSALTRGGRLQEAIAGLRAARDAHLAVKINTVVLEDTKQAELETLRDFASTEGVALQTISRYSLHEEKRDTGVYDRPPPCSSCNRLRLLADGRLRSCLHADKEFAVDFGDIEGSLRAAIAAKPERGQTSVSESVGSIGG